MSVVYTESAAAVLIHLLFDVLYVWAIGAHR